MSTPSGPPVMPGFPSMDFTSGLLQVAGAAAAAESQSAATMLGQLHRRLRGELLRDVDEVLASLSPNFELTTYSPGLPPQLTSRTEMAEGLRQAFAAGLIWMMWMDFDHVVASAETLAGHGVLNTVVPGAAPEGPDGPGPASWTRSRIAFFIDFRDGAMEKEVLFMDPGAASTSMVDVPGDQNLAAIGLRIPPLSQHGLNI